MGGSAWKEKKRRKKEVLCVVGLEVGISIYKVGIETELHAVSTAESVWVEETRPGQPQARPESIRIEIRVGLYHKL